MLGEMMKAGKEILIDILVKLIKILTCCIYPYSQNNHEQWKVINPVHKKGSIYETSNY